MSAILTWKRIVQDTLCRHHDDDDQEPTEIGMLMSSVIGGRWNLEATNACSIASLGSGKYFTRARGARCTTELETEDLNSKSPTTIWIICSSFPPQFIWGRMVTSCPHREPIVLSSYLLPLLCRLSNANWPEGISPTVTLPHHQKSHKTATVFSYSCWPFSRLARQNLPVRVSAS